MEILKTLLTLMLPAVGAAFAWLLNIARKDPLLFWEIDKVLAPWIKKAMLYSATLGAINLYMFPDGRVGLAILLALIFYSLIQLNNTLPFFRRVAKMGSKDPQKGEE